MGVPTTKITFATLADTAVVRSSRGTVALLLSDSTANGSAIAIYKREADIPATGQWSADNIKNIKLVLKSGTAVCMAVRVLQTETADDYAKTLNSIDGMDWDWCAAPSADSTEVAAIVTWIKAARAAGKTYKAVLGGATAPDSEGIVNLATTNIKAMAFGEATAVTYTPGAYSPRVAGVLAGLPLDNSATGYVFEDVTEADASSAPGTDIDAGKLLIVFNGSGYEIARAVTSLTTTTSAPALFKKIKHVEGADMIAKDVKMIWKSNFKGKKNNSYAHKQDLCAEILAYLGKLLGTVLDPVSTPACEVDFDAQKSYLRSAGVDVDTMSDMDVLKARTGEKVFLAMSLSLIDAMEDLELAATLD